MNSYKNVLELIVTSSNEDQEGILERASTSLPREQIPNYRVILEIFHSSAETVAEEDYFDISANSLESDCKRMKQNSSPDSREP